MKAASGGAVAAEALLTGGQHHVEKVDEDVGVLANNAKGFLADVLKLGPLQGT